MVQVKKAVKICDRCSFGGEQPATAERIFALEDRYYLLDLCDQHAAMFDRDIAGWTRLAAECDAPTLSTHSAWKTGENTRVTQRIQEISAKARADEANTIFARKRAEQIEAEIAKESEARAYRSIPGALAWRLTNHTRDRMKQRQFAIDEVLTTAAAPTTLVRQPWRGPFIVVLMRGTCRIVVNDDTHVIITVIDRADILETEATAPTLTRSAL